ncbi:MAG: hypothetical protein ACK5PF_09550 [bacterium]
MKTNPALAALRHHVSGAIARGESEAIVEQPARKGPTPAAELTKDDMVRMLASFIGQRPGIDPRNYHDYASYRQESREVTKDAHDAYALLDAVASRDSLTADAMRAELMGSGRLTLSEDGRLDYCTGQYFPTEYRKAAARALASMLWDYWREDLKDIPGFGSNVPMGERIRRTARNAFRRRSVLRYFN